MSRSPDEHDDAFRCIDGQGYLATVQAKNSDQKRDIALLPSAKLGSRSPVRQPHVRSARAYQAFE